MKKLAALLLIVVLLMPCALADQRANMEIYQVENTMLFDFDFDGTEEAMELTVDIDECGDGSFTLKVGENECRVDDCCSLVDEVWVMHMGWDELNCYGTLFMVPEYGMSDDPLTYCFYYVSGKLGYAGKMYALPRNMKRTDVASITTSTRASLVGTWSRPTDYVLAQRIAYDMDWDYMSEFYIAESPRDLYQMNMMVTLNMNLPLYRTRFDSMPTMALAPNQKVIFTATDDVTWVYVTNLEGTMGGWFRVNYRTVEVLNKDIDEVFSDIFYAD